MLKRSEFLQILTLKTKILMQKFKFSLRKNKTRGESGLMAVIITLNLDKKSTESGTCVFIQKGQDYFGKGQG